MKNHMKYWAILALSAPVAALAEGEPASAVPAAVTGAITDLQNAATDYAAVIFPYVAKVGLAFVGIGVLYLLFRVWRRFAGGR